MQKALLLFLLISQRELMAVGPSPYELITYIIFLGPVHAAWMQQVCAYVCVCVCTDVHKCVCMHACVRL